MKKYALSAVTGLLLSLLASGEAKASSFSFTQIADTTAFSSVSSPSINDSSTVAFRANSNDLSNIFTSDGGALTNIASTTTMRGGLVGSPAISNTGTVAYYSAGLPRDASVIVRGGGITGSAYLGYVAGEAPSINDSGTVVYNGGAPQGFESIGASDGSRQTQLAFSLAPTLSDASINNAGIVAFSGSLPIFISGGPPQSQTGLFTTTSSNGGQPTPVLLANSSFGDFDNPSINDQGTIAFSGRSNGVAGIFTIDSNRSLTTITDASGLFNSFGNLSLNEQETVAFEANLDTGGNGIFIGSDPVTDKVIATGDSLFNSSVTSLDFSSLGLNNSGQVAFFARLANGTTGIFRANPVSVPEPASALGVLAFGALAGSMLKRKQ